MLRLRKRRAPEQELVLDLGDGKSPQRRRADARKAHYEHQKRLLEVGGADPSTAGLDANKSDL